MWTAALFLGVVEKNHVRLPRKTYLYNATLILCVFPRRRRGKTQVYIRTVVIFLLAAGGQRVHIRSAVVFPACGGGKRELCKKVHNHSA